MSSGMVVFAVATVALATAIQPPVVGMSIDDGGVKQGPLLRRQYDGQETVRAIFSADGETTIEDEPSIVEKSHSLAPTVTASFVVHSCRHNTYVDTANPERMKTGSYCVDHTDYTKAADGSIMTQEDLEKCGDANFGGMGGGFQARSQQCPVVRSCTHETFKDAANPNRMKYGDAYCFDLTADTVAASGALATRAELDNCRQLTTGGGGFKPKTELCGGKIDSTDAKCNSYTCPTDWYLRRNAPDLNCVDDECKEEMDKVRCCKALTREATGKKCANSQALNWFEDWTLEECVTWAVNTGATYFIYGKVGTQKDRRCWWQRSTAPTTCTGDECCSCPAEDPKKPWTACKMATDDYDYYKLT